MPKFRAKRLVIKTCTVLIILSLLLTPGAQAQTISSSSLPEPYKYLYVIYSHPELKTFSIELRNQIKNLDGSVTANIAVRSDGLIAYNLNFDESKTSGEYWESVDFLPLYPSHVYEIATITIEPGGYFKIQGTKFGLEESVLPKMTLVQMCILVMHLVGAKPPVDTYELGQAAAESFDKVPGLGGAIANLALFRYELFGKEKKPVQGMLDLGDAISEYEGGSDFIANGINLISKGNGAKVTGSSVKTFFKAINVLEMVSDTTRAIKAFQGLRNPPDLIEATITLAPEVANQPDRYRILEINQPFTSEVVYKNISSEVWSPEQNYGLFLTQEALPIGFIQLETMIPRDKEARWEIQQQAPPIPGIYHLAYPMTISGIPVGSHVKAEIVVVPEKSDDLQDLIRAMIDEAKHQAGEKLDELAADLERRIMEAIANEIQRRLQEICGGTGVAITIGSLGIWSHRKNSAKKRSKNV